MYTEGSLKGYPTLGTSKTYRNVTPTLIIQYLCLKLFCMVISIQRVYICYTAISIQLYTKSLGGDVNGP